ncbi:MAG: DUF429 domain-containing protein [Verrucomicrobiota bacterium]|jgi:predicted RNase H-like nuclease
MARMQVDTADMDGSLRHAGEAWMLGIDLAWGERRPDGVALLHATRDGATWQGGGLVQGDDALMAWIRQRIPDGAAVLAAVDAPLVCPNETGSRPVDRETHRWFGRQHAGCHPSNGRLCRRPLRIASLLRAGGFDLGWDMACRRQAAEVFPHPAMVRWFGLQHVLKYKRPPVARRRAEFLRCRQLLGSLLGREFAGLKAHAEVDALLGTPWSKPAEDRLDAFMCALMAWWHWRDGGARTQVLGDVETGFVLVPGAADGIDRCPTPGPA